MAYLSEHKLKELIKVTRGASLSGQYFEEEGDLIRLTLGNFDYANGGFKENTSKDNLFYSGPVADNFIMNEGDIITPMTEQTPGLLGSTAKIPESGKYIQSQDVGLVTCNEEMIDKDFCYYLLPSEIVKKQLAAGAQQTKIRHTSPDKIEACTVFVPKPKEQRKIGKILSTIDKLIDLKRKENVKLEEIAKQIYDYWFVQFDFPNEVGEPYKSSGGIMVWNEKLKKDIPEGWSDCALNFYIGRITNGLNPRKNFVLGKGKNYYVTIRNLTGTDIDWDNCDHCDDEALVKINSRSQLEIGDVIFSAIGTIGRTYFIQDPPTNWNISETSFTIRAKENIDPYFFYALLRSEEIQKNADKNAMGSTLRCLVMDAFSNILTVKIDPYIIKRFAERVTPIYKKKCEINRENRQLKQLRDYLLPLLMNGQVTIKD